ncbi:ArsR/SmtB family transcription factor [Methanocaldococcus sp.]
MDEVSERILLYLSQVGKATNKEIAEAFNINPGLISKKLQYLQDNGLIKVVEQEGRTKYYALVTSTQPSIENDNTAVIKIDLSKVKTLSQLRDIINSYLKSYNWSIGNYELVITALTIAKFTNLRLLVFGSQGIGKTCCIKAVFPNNEVFIEYDLHRKQLKEVVNLREHIKIIEQQYRHTWGVENPATFDSYAIVPLSKIAPSDLIFRFLPIRVLQYKYIPNYKPVVFEFSNLKLIEPPKDVCDNFYNEMKHLLFFNNDEAFAKAKIEDMKYHEILNLYGLNREQTVESLSAEQWKIERKYERFLKNPFHAVNLKALQEDPEMWFRASQDMQLMRNAYEVLKFAFSLSRSMDAVKDAYNFVMEILGTWTRVLDNRPRRNNQKLRVRCEAQPYYVDSHGVVHNVI